MIKDIEALAKYESYFYSATKADYIRALWDSDFAILIPIYEKWTGQKSNVNKQCGKCKLEFMKKFGKLYFKNKEELKLKEDAKVNKQGNQGKDKVCSGQNSKRSKQKKS